MESVSLNCGVNWHAPSELHMWDIPGSNQRIAAARFKHALILGDGAFAIVIKCGRKPVVKLYKDEATRQERWHTLQAFGCGSGCLDDHAQVNI